jgi:hypothetical protein
MNGTDPEWVTVCVIFELLVGPNAALIMIHSQRREWRADGNALVGYVV